MKISPRTASFLVIAAIVGMIVGKAFAVPWSPAGSSPLGSKDAVVSDVNVLNVVKSQVYLTNFSKGQSTINRDEEYRALLRNFERLKAVWKQQPENFKALERYVGVLRNHVIELRGSLKALEPETQAPPTRELPTSKATTKVPSGPVRPSSKPSTEENVKKRKEATLKKFLSPGFFDKHSFVARSLIGVSESWITRSCNKAEHELEKIDGMLRTPSVNRDAVSQSLERLQKILYRLETPPPSTRPVVPG